MIYEGMTYLSFPETQKNSHMWYETVLLDIMKIIRFSQGLGRPLDFERGGHNGHNGIAKRFPPI